MAHPAPDLFLLARHLAPLIKTMCIERDNRIVN
jgi:hypothetical protein